MILPAVRNAGPESLEALVMLCAEHAAFEHAPYDLRGIHDRLHAALFGDRPAVRAWLAMAQGEITGYATVTEEYSTWNAAAFLHLDCLYVRPAFRNAGFGAKLFATVVQHARERNLLELQWQTPAWNDAACRFYARHGGIGQQKVRFRLPVGPST